MSTIPTTTTIIWKGPQKKRELGDQILKILRTYQPISQLIDDVLKKGDLVINIAYKDDTRYERNRRAIYVYAKKDKSEMAAAILFELNNANNPHTYTDAIEQTLSTLSNQGVDLTAMDLFYVATEAEKDEFFSLINYRKQVEGFLKTGNTDLDADILHEKYEDLNTKDRQNFYTSYTEQNLDSDHTLDMAEAYYHAYFGKMKRPSNFKWPNQLDLNKVSSDLTKNQPNFDLTAAL